MTSHAQPVSSPRHVAVIMDGNGRWAKKNNLPRLKGHHKGSDSVRETINAAMELGVEYLTLYAFSVENWKRPKTEVAGLMELLAITLKNQMAELQKNNIRLLAIGRLHDLPEKVQKQLNECIQVTSKNTRMTLILALSYGGRAELVDAAKKIAQQVAEGKISPEKIDENIFEQNLYTSGIPDPDLLIRTSGEMRLSNFLLWQMSYTEIYVTPTLWPDFKKEDFFRAVEDFQSRQRRFGGI